MWFYEPREFMFGSELAKYLAKCAFVVGMR